MNKQESKISSIAKQPVSQLATIPWGCNLAILKKCKDHSEQLTQSLPDSLKSSLPTIEELEKELSRDLENGNDEANKD